MKQSIILFRHGAVESEKNIFCGWLNLPLSSKGEAQAEALAKKLSCEKIDYGFCSDLLRGQQVLAAVLAMHPKAQVIIDPRLRERHYGKLSGVSKDLIKKSSRSRFEKIHRHYHSVPEGGESFFDVSKRVFPFMNDLLRFMQKEKCSVAISAHTNSLRIIQEYLEGLTPVQAALFEHHPEHYKKYVVEFD